MSCEIFGKYFSQTKLLNTIAIMIKFVIIYIFHSTNVKKYGIII